MSLHEQIQEEASQRAIKANDQRTLGTRLSDCCLHFRGKTLPQLQRLLIDLKSKGAFSKFGEFSLDLLRPFRRIRERSFEEFVKDLKSTIAMKPQSLVTGFVMWNTLAFWFSILEGVRTRLITDAHIMLVSVAHIAAHIFADPSHAYWQSTLSYWSAYHDRRLPSLVFALLDLRVLERKTVHSPVWLSGARIRAAMRREHTCT